MTIFRQRLKLDVENEWFTRVSIVRMKLYCLADALVCLKLSCLVGFLGGGGEGPNREVSRV